MLALEATIKRVCGAKPIDLNVSSADYKMGLEFLLYCKSFATAINETMQMDIIPLHEWTQETGKFANGSRIMVISSDPKAFRGRKDEVLLDEFAFHENQDELYKAVQPILIRSPETQLTIVSSHNGSESLFNRFCRQAEMESGPFNGGWHRITLEDACKDGFALSIEGEHKKLLDGTTDGVKACSDAFVKFVRESCSTLEDYEQEYNCQPAKYSCMIQSSEYDRLVLLNDGQPIPIPETLEMDRAYGPLYVGVDCGRVHDYTVVWVLEEGIDPTAPEHLRSVYRTVCVKGIKNAPFGEQEAIIRPIITHPAVSAGLVDMGAVGRSLADSIQEETGDIVQPYAFTAPRVARAAELVRQHVQQMRVSLHPDPLIRSDLLCVRKTQTREGRRVYGGSTKETHGDFFFALGLALEAKQKQSKSYFNVIEQEQNKLENQLTGAKAIA